MLKACSVSTRRMSCAFPLPAADRLIDNLGTSTGSRVVQLYNGRARISIRCNGGACTAGVTSEGIAPAFVTISSLMAGCAIFARQTVRIDSQSRSQQNCLHDPLIAFGTVK